MPEGRLVCWWPNCPVCVKERERQQPRSCPDDDDLFHPRTVRPVLAGLEASLEQSAKGSLKAGVGGPLSLDDQRSSERQWDGGNFAGFEQDDRLSTDNLLPGAVQVGFHRDLHLPRRHCVSLFRPGHRFRGATV